MDVEIHLLERLKVDILRIAKDKNHIPSYHELRDEGVITYPKKIQELFVKYTGGKYQDYCIENGFHKKNTSRFANYTFDGMCDLWERWYKEHGYYPVEVDCRKKNYLPMYETLMEVLGDKRYEFTSKFKMPLTPNVNDYHKYKEAFIRESDKLGFAIKQKDLESTDFDFIYIIPSSRWMIKHYPDKNVVCYNTLVEHMGFKPRYSISKEMATEMILEKYKQNGRILTSDFYGGLDQEQDLGITTITNHWGSFNNMLKDLNLPINWINLRDEKSVEDAKEDILKVCTYVEASENRKKISQNDIEQSEWCLSPSFYRHYFEDVVGITLRQYIESLGYEMFDAGLGMNFSFEDGERALSQWEYKVSNHLRKSGLTYGEDYRKDVYYKTFVENYVGQRTIDYVIFDKYYVEVAGVVGRKEYDSNMKEKIEMLEKANLEYFIVYPDDLNSKPLDEVFYFIQERNVTMIDKENEAS